MLMWSFKCVLALAILLESSASSCFMACISHALSSHLSSKKHFSDDEKLRENILESWRKLHTAKFPPVQKLSVLQELVDGKEQKVEYPYLMKVVKGNRIKIITSKQDIDLKSRLNSNDSNVEIQLLNPSYFASLISSKNGQLISDGLYGVKENPSMYQEFREGAEWATIGNPLWARLYISITWPGIFESNGFTLLGWKEGDWNGERSVVIDFTYDPDRHGKIHQHGYYHSSHLGIEKGRVVLLANNFYVPVEWEVDLVDPGESRATYRWNISMDYDLESEGVPLVVGRREQGSPLSGAKIPRRYSERKFTYDFSARIQDSEFTLSHFRLPEPNWYKPAKPWWFYTSIVGMVLLVGGAVVFHFGKRLWREGSAKKNSKQRK
jgi:hypothetical protein